METAYDHPPVRGGRLEHHYGPDVHVLADAWALSMVARVGHPDTRNPALLMLVESCFWQLFRATVEQLPTIETRRATRMTAAHPTAAYAGRIVDPMHPVVVVDIARAGILPAHVHQKALLEILDPSAVRVDHIYMQRVSDPVTGAVTGVDLTGSKIGGPIDGATIIIPDPMGATGSSVLAAIKHYRDVVPGTPARIITCHLMVTPEFIRRITTEAPGVVIYCLRVDRGLSPPDVLRTPLGARWDEERGLDEHDYIVPGAGGMGEVINNAFV